MEKMEVAVLPMSPALMASTISRHPSAYLSAPASSRRFGDPSNCYLFASAPASPSRVAAVFHELSNWEDEEEEEEEKKKKKHDYSAAGDHDGDIDDPEPFDFANGFSGQLDKEGRLAVPDLATADELFEQGVIRPLNLQADRGKEYERDVRGRAVRASISDAAASRSRRASRSLSPARGAEKDYFFEVASSLQSTAASADPSLVKGGGGSKKWKLMDMFLFRSASEGRATGRGSKDPLCRFSVSCSSSSSSSSSSSFLPSLFRKRKAAAQEDASINAGTSRPSGSTRRGRRPSSVHAMHLAASRAASEEMRKKAPLPYHPNALFGYLRHNAAIQSISRKFTSS